MSDETTLVGYRLHLDIDGVPVTATIRASRTTGRCTLEISGGCLKGLRLVSADQKMTFDLVSVDTFVLVGQALPVEHNGKIVWFRIEEQADQPTVIAATPPPSA